MPMSNFDFSQNSTNVFLINSLIPIPRNYMASKKRILILTSRPLHNGPRMIREFDILKNEYVITALGYSAPLDKEIKFIQYQELVPITNKILNALFRKLFIYKFTNRIFEKFPRIESYILKNDIDLVITHEAFFLPMLTSLQKKKNFKIIYNAHEYHPLEFDNDKKWLETSGRYNTKLYKDYLNSVDLLVNVCDGIAQKCKEDFGKDSLVIPNAAFYSNSPIVENTSDEIRMIHHGSFMRSRKIEEMIKVVSLLGSNYSLDIMAVVHSTQQSYFEEIGEMIKDMPNIKFIDIVPYKEIVPTIRKYDIGLYLLSPNNFNDSHALPNKLFEFIQAKLAIAISPSIEMKKIVEKYDLGVVAEDFTPETLASKIASLSRADISRFKQNSQKASVVESAEQYGKRYLNAVNALFND